MPTNLGGGTNESRIVLVNRLGFAVWESAPYLKMADQSTTLSNRQAQGRVLPVLCGAVMARRVLQVRRIRHLEQERHYDPRASVAPVDGE